VYLNLRKDRQRRDQDGIISTHIIKLIATAMEIPHEDLGDPTLFEDETFAISPLDKLPSQ